MLLERDRKLVEAQVKDMHTRLDDAENNALKVKTYVMVIKSQKFSSFFILSFFGNVKFVQKCKLDHYHAAVNLSTSDEVKVLQD